MWLTGTGLDMQGRYTFEYQVSREHWSLPRRQRWIEFAFATRRNVRRV